MKKIFKYLVAGVILLGVLITFWLVSFLGCVVENYQCGNDLLSQIILKIIQ